MARLASRTADMKRHYTVVVIGSGYGGGIAASRLSRAGQSVCVLERGKEIRPGEYPDTMAEALRETQTDAPEGHVGSRAGLYDFRTNQDISVFQGCGLGGTSLVNANVSLTAEPGVFDSAWPREIRDEFNDLPPADNTADLFACKSKYYQLALDMLRPLPYPEDFPKLAKLATLEKSSGATDKFYRPQINVTFQSGKNHVGVQQEECVLCGDCVTGCNHHAKNTVLMNYLPDAKNHGAAIFTEVCVRWVEQADEQWRIHYQVLDSGREKFDAPTQFVSADIVVLSAGTLGSTEILLRSRQKGLMVSDMLGKRFSGNADVLGFAYNNDESVNGVGYGERAPEKMRESTGPVGPCITGIIDSRGQGSLEDGLVIEEGVMPGLAGKLLPGVFAVAAGLVGVDTDDGILDKAKEAGRELESWVRGPYHGAVRNTQTYLGMGHENDMTGFMKLVDDRLRIEWPAVGRQEIFKTINKRLEKATASLGGTYVRNPVWSKITKEKLVTVHPLGGCIMADDAQGGVVNHKGQVFERGNGNGVYETLYVSDGAVVPRSVGVNPLLTISALAERTCDLMARDRGWEIDYALPSSPREPVEETAERLGIKFTESMCGHFSTEIRDEDYKKGAERGKETNSPFRFILTIESDDLDRIIEDDQHPARMTGTVDAPVLSDRPLTVSDGHFNLFVRRADAPDTYNMWYRMKMTSEENRTFFFEGFKVIRNDPGMDMWPDTTTLYITVYDGDSNQSPVHGRGILVIEPADFMKQLTTMKVLGAASTAQALKAQARFARFFSGFLYDTYLSWRHRGRD